MVLYCEFFNEKYMYWLLKTNIKDLEQEITKRTNIGDCIRMGFIFCDHFNDAREKLGQHIQHLDYEPLKYFQDIKLDSQHYLKRSIYCHF